MDRPGDWLTIHCRSEACNVWATRVRGVTLSVQSSTQGRLKLADGKR
jgi:hypothetical protein